MRGTRVKEPFWCSRVWCRVMCTGLPLRARLVRLGLSGDRRDVECGTPFGRVALFAAELTEATVWLGTGLMHLWAAEILIGVGGGLCTLLAGQVVLHG